MEKIGKWIGATFLALCVVTLSPAQVPYSSAELKAAFLFNFGTFVQWPDSRAAEKKGSFKIGIFGSTEIASALSLLVKGEKVRGRVVEVVQVNDDASAGACDIVYIGAGKELELHLVPLTSSAVLTVGETDRFENDGGIIRFLPGRNRVRLRINVDAAEKAGLHISSQLLRLAETKGL